MKTLKKNEVVIENEVVKNRNYSFSIVAPDQQQGYSLSKLIKLNRSLVLDCGISEEGGSSTYSLSIEERDLVIGKINDQINNYLIEFDDIRNMVLEKIEGLFNFKQFCFLYIAIFNQKTSYLSNDFKKLIYNHIDNDEIRGWNLIEKRKFKAIISRISPIEFQVFGSILLEGKRNYIDFFNNIIL